MKLISIAFDEDGVVRFLHDIEATRKEVISVLSEAITMINEEDPE